MNIVWPKPLMYELGLSPDFQPFEYTSAKTPEYLAINPNGRAPAIYDPNSDLTLWESGAILEYLVEKYDKDHKVSFAPGTPEYYHAKQWLHFQTSGQGPYYGQAIWFVESHSEKLPTVIERYVGEIKRVTGVLEGYLSKQEKGADGPWLVGGKFSYVDLAWNPWQTGLDLVYPHGFDPDEYPVVKDWLVRMSKRPSIKRVLDSKPFPTKPDPSYGQGKA